MTGISETIYVVNIYNIGQTTEAKGYTDVYTETRALGSLARCGRPHKGGQVLLVKENTRRRSGQWARLYTAAVSAAQKSRIKIKWTDEDFFYSHILCLIAFTAVSSVCVGYTYIGVFVVAISCCLNSKRESNRGVIYIYVTTAKN